jgi:DNA-binding transcriptional MerR regulator
MDEEYTIDELARHVGLPSSTIRLYQHRGILPPPRRHGRAAYYGAGHIARIQLVGRLQQRGFSLAAIADLVKQWEHGRGLDEILGLERQLSGSDAPEPVRLTLAELAARFPGAEISAASVKRAVDLGLVEVEGDDVVVTNPDFLEVGSALVGLGFPLDEVLDEAAELDSATDRIAERFGAMFERNVWRPFADAGMPAERLPEITRILDAVGPLARRVVQASLQRSLDEIAARLIVAEAAQDRSD